ncbi:hypothetical protein DFP73DRAFT_602029 [Morchella snyderi]|nr:hypothetical protein DFP73DRAFT_602029 [Morchella snyderi]
MQPPVTEHGTIWTPPRQRILDQIDTYQGGSRQLSGQETSSREVSGELSGRVAQRRGQRRSQQAGSSTANSAGRKLSGELCSEQINLQIINSYLPTSDILGSTATIIVPSPGFKDCKLQQAMPSYNISAAFSQYTAMFLLRKNTSKMPTAELQLKPLPLRILCHHLKTELIHCNAWMIKYRFFLSMDPVRVTGLGVWAAVADRRLENTSAGIRSQFGGKLRCESADQTIAAPRLVSRYPPRRIRKGVSRYHQAMSVVV